MKAIAAKTSLKRVPLFSELSDEEIGILEARSRRRGYPAKTQILWRGDAGDTLFVVESGRVKVHATTETGMEVTLNVLGRGECFGELSLIDGAPRSADVSTMEPTECTLVEGEAFRDALEQNPGLPLRLLRRFTKMVRTQNLAVESFAAFDASRRVALLLLQLANAHGEPWPETESSSPADSPVMIGLSLTKSDIGSFVGVTREHVTKILKDYARLQYIDYDPRTGRIIVLRREELAGRTH
jgi:CRP-like cAMP-binding protein